MGQCNERRYRERAENFRLKFPTLVKISSYEDSRYVDQRRFAKPEGYALFFASLSFRSAAKRRDAYFSAAIAASVT